MQIKKIIYILFLLFAQLAYAQTNLVQTFMEENGSLAIGWEIEALAMADLNGDNIDDLAVGEISKNDNQGRVYIYYGGPGFDGSPDFYIDGENNDDRFGSVLENAGDLNNDGYDDLLVSALGYNEGKGRIYAFFGGPAMDTTPDGTYDAPTQNTVMICNMAAGGDVNHDGYDDFLIGRWSFESGCYGEVYLYYGNSSLNTTPTMTFTGTADVTISHGIAIVGDVNNDNYDDWAISQGSDMGAVNIYYGGPGLDSSPDLVMSGMIEGIGFGANVAGNMDLNGDGYADVAIGAISYSNVASDAGCVYIYYGDEAGMDNTHDFIIECELANAQFGGYLANAGQLNNDGYDDLLVYAVGSDFQGLVFCYFGGSTMDANADITIIGQTEWKTLGWILAGNGDLNDDGYMDFVLGSRENNSNDCFVYWGGATPDNTIDMTISGIYEYEPFDGNGFGIKVASAGDVNNDGHNDIMLGAGYYQDHNGDVVGRVYLYYGGPSMDNTADLTMTGTVANSKFAHSMAAAGDVNNDGYDDILVGASDEDNGVVYLYLGGADMDTLADVTMSTTVYNSEFGKAVSGAGDVNGDGYDDIIIGSPNCNTRAGMVHLFYGGESISTTADLVANGSSYNYLGCSVSGGGDWNNDGYDDIIAGAYGYNNNTGLVYIYYGGETPDLVPDLTINHMPNGDYFGWNVCMVGDVNNDSYDDILATVTRPISENKTVYLYLGNNSDDVEEDVLFSIKATMHNPISISYTGDLNGDNYDDMIIGNATHSNDTGQFLVFLGGETVDNVADVIINGENAFDEFAVSIAGVGDVNYDGINDFLIGAPSVGDNGFGYLYNLDANLASTGVKLFLQGAYDADAADPVMTTELAGNIPTTSPYSDGRTVSSVPADVTDWVWLELRSSQDGVADYGRSYFLRSDGCLVDDETSRTILDLTSQVAAGNYYIVVKHRNHLGVESATAQTIGSNMATYDFSTAATQCLGNNAPLLESGVYGIYSGDCGCDGIVTNADKDPVNVNMDASGYQNGDMNMDGMVTNADKDFINTNMDVTTAVNN